MYNYENRKKDRKIQRADNPTNDQTHVSQRENFDDLWPFQTVSLGSLKQIFLLYYRITLKHVNPNLRKFILNYEFTESRKLILTMKLRKLF